MMFLTHFKIYFYEHPCFSKSKVNKSCNPFVDSSVNVHFI